ncbi:hypothetical protein L227DRAFT_417057 [Lentinus tigrinus ALCF2SS1-6]|uniref:Uncharacterized protein n=1 Tax=Lentinus tigrinus ALCF2SS1-6 TaxID=1328759 RepID=A0A5C2SNZ5_9APHY|nr:hypothetical protein L227DRAFT_417057 [Lentinus tigrinus ALCF2SS1-6]
MLGHKRRASDTLLPLRAPKQPRITTHHPLGGNSTPSQDYALLARWTRLTVDFMHILKDTASFFLRLTGGTQEEPIYVPSRSVSAPVADEPGTIPSPPPSPPPARPPQYATKVSAPRKLPPRQPIPIFPAPPTTSHQLNQLSTSAPAAHGIHQRVQSGRDSGREQRPYLKAYANMETNAVASTSKNTLSGPYDHKVSDLHEDPRSTGLMSPPSTQDSTSSIVSQATQTYPELGAALQQNARKRRKSVKGYVEREHIHAKAVSSTPGMVWMYLITTITA